MLRQGIRRCSILADSGAMSSLALHHSRPASLYRRSLPLALGSVALLPRAYCSEASAETESRTQENVPQYIVHLASCANVFPSMYELLDQEHERFQKGTRTMLGSSRLPAFGTHSRLTHASRTRTADRFRSTKEGVLFSSDVTARGMDFPDITHVIQVDLPRDRESYIHRLGRTARQDRVGEGWLLVPPTSIRPTQQLLDGLPLQPNCSLASAAIDIHGATTLPHYHQELAEITRSCPDTFDRAYISLFNQASVDKEGLARDLNAWAVEGCGVAQPPRV
ncbi:uncharacterized protein N7496_007443 [Penicillium cataractarum]|uniref:ATP-dependent RNA helicase n=1 Tax=Penicillium cataractarum TaxID=2100454 RepID=A0A9W9V9M0_9EURO|nr:uncharacterized protein N7496_007443 [Penicillium cataractarum]KAJ5371351.1 hypothetical protein N7496_007443 [Penicillium cataractarum]